MHKSATRLEKQCERYELEIERILVRPIKNSELWVGSDGSEKRPEEIALEHYTQRGCSGSWCEGGTLNLLMKAASLPVLVRYNIFADPDDAIRRFFEAQCVILADHRSEILHAIESSQTSNIEAAATKIIQDSFIREFYPRVTFPVLLALWRALGPSRLTSIASVFLEWPYDYRAGWPDLTLICDSGLRFVEVKTTDSLLESQIRIIESFAKPLALQFAVAHVTSD